ncbi:hypothetical protein SDC9_77042 [bioreactor metagenome]|uniref:Uncharacterized protein n=1 Tax=bioreactor metagenome TaxID=1076179 RepID=A0A644YPE0_9ZZZZ
MDQGICNGGQKVKLELTLNGEILEPYMSSVGLEIKPCVCFLINSFEVNGEELTNEENPIYLTSEREPEYNPELMSDEEKQITENIREAHESSLFTDEYGFVTVEGYIGLFQIKTGDSLATFLHEKGHILVEDGDLDVDDNLQLKQQIQEIEPVLKDLKTSRMFSNIANPYTGKKRERTPQDEDILILTEEINNLYKKKIFDERRASIKALEFLRSHPNMFPRDPNNIRAKLFYSAALSTYIRESKYRNEAFKSEATRMVDFDQDWHY